MQVESANRIHASLNVLAHSLKPSLAAAEHRVARIGGACHV